MEKDYITINKKDGSLEKMEVVVTFKLNDNSKDIIIYKDSADKYYVASYDDKFNLNTDFSEMEKEKINQMFEILRKEGVINA